jgi:hypothetical protein
MIRTKTFDVDFQIIRRPPVVRVKGRPIDGGKEQILEGRGSFQPATAKDLQRLPEGQRTDLTLALFTDCDLLTGDVPDQRPDHIIPTSGTVYKGIEFEIQAGEEWPSYRKYLAIKVGQ